MRARPLVLGMPLIGDGLWPGGLNYQRAVLQAVAARLSGRLQIRVIVPPQHEAIARDAFGPWLTLPLVVDPRSAGAGRGQHLAATLMTGRQRSMAEIVREHAIDVMFETARFFGVRFPAPTLVWFPDLQHRHLPHLFGRVDWWRREIGFRAQARGRRLVLLSSQTARADCEAFYPDTRGRTAVARFAGQIDIAAVRARAAGVTAAHGLPARIFYLPNQFWAHKNHGTVLQALALIRDRGGLADLPPVVMSGPTTDHRDPGLFARTMDRARALGVADHFRHLGLIPYADVLALNAAAVALINPSLFEGWASSVEEAKSLGTPLILSDIPVHREQAPDARFFGPAAPEALAEALMAAAAGPAPARPDPATLAARNDSRIRAFADGFLDAVERCHALAG